MERSLTVSWTDPAALGARAREMAAADGRVTRASDGQLLAHGKSTCMIMPVG